MKVIDIIVRPVITEKATKLSQSKVYTFQVMRDSNKMQITETIEKLYGVEVDSVRISVRKGKEKKVGRRMIVKKLPDTKIAFVKVKKGSIDLFPQS
jgi:large subunit ribosomal protein L23